MMKVIIKQCFNKYEIELELHVLQTLDGKFLNKNLVDHGLDIPRFIDIDKKKISQKICRLPVISYTELSGLNCFIVVCAGTKGARKLIKTD